MANELNYLQLIGRVEIEYEIRKKVVEMTILRLCKPGRTQSTPTLTLAVHKYQRKEKSESMQKGGESPRL